MDTRQLKIGSWIHVYGMLCLGIFAAIVREVWTMSCLDCVPWILLALCVGAQGFYLWRTGRIENLTNYSDLETIDNEMVFSEDDQNHEIIANSGFDIFTAVIGGVLSTFFLIVMIVALRGIFSSSWSDAPQALTKLLMLWSGLLGIFSVLYNFRTYNANGMK
jgi:hypothetical protein